MRSIAMVLCAALSMAGCVSAPPPERIVTQRVDVPVATFRMPPDELLAPIATAMPQRVFVPLAAPDAAVAVTAAGRDAIIQMFAEMKRRLAAWRAWAGADLQ